MQPLFSCEDEQLSSLQLDYLRGKTVNNCFLPLPGRYATPYEYLSVTFGATSPIRRG